MNEIASFDELTALIERTPFLVAYFSRPDCGVCTALKPKIRDIVAGHDRAHFQYVNLDAVPEAAAQHSIFTIPGILVFVDGKETIREARYIDTETFAQQVARLYGLRFEDA